MRRSRGSIRLDSVDYIPAGWGSELRLLDSLVCVHDWHLERIRI